MSNAGFKQTLKELEPVSLFSFDGEKATENPRFLAGQQIFDEMGNAEAHIALEHTREEFPCYHLTNGLTPIDAYDQRSLRFCPYGLQPNAPADGLSLFPKAYIIAPGVREWDFADNEFTYIVQGRTDYSYINWQDSDPEYKDKKRWSHSSHLNMLFVHEGVISVYDSLSSTFNYLCIHIPEIHGTNKNNAIAIKDLHSFSNRETDYPDLLTVRYNKGLLTVFKNLTKVYEQRLSVDDARTDFNRTRRELTIGGTNEDYVQNIGGFADRCVIPTTLDNFAIFNYALQDAEIIRLYRKMFNFNDLILKEQANQYLPFDDAHKPNFMPRNLGRSKSDFRLTGNVNNIVTKEKGPFQLGYSTLFLDNAMEGYHVQNSGGNMFNPLKDFTLFLHFQAVNTDQGILLEQTLQSSTFYGFTLSINSKNGEAKSGTAELIVHGHKSITLTDTLALNEWNEFIMCKRNEQLTVYFNKTAVVINDTIKYDNHYTKAFEIDCTRLLIGRYQQHPTKAKLANFVVWTSAVSPYFLQALVDYEYVSYVRGIVTTAGRPMRAKVRAYNHVTGELINEVWSDEETGAYVIHLLDNTPVDLVVVDDKDILSRVRAYGPIQPYSRPYNTHYLSY